MFLNLLTSFGDTIKTSFLIKLPNSKEIKIGESYGKPAFQVIINNEQGLRALKSGNELKICEAYIYQDFDLIGKIDMMKLLEVTKLFSKEHAVLSWLSQWIYFFQDQIHINKRSIAEHYELDDEFYLLFLDKTRAYSHGIFQNDEESLDIANARKLDFAMTSCQLSPGQKVLDIGTGWGCIVEHLGSHGIHVNALTISKHSADFVANLIKNKNLAHCEVNQIDFLNYNPALTESYDAVFSLGTLEHLPDYDKVLSKCSTLLKSGGYAYFDASAIASTRGINSRFIDKYIFPGNHRCLDIFRFLNAVKNSSFDLISLHNDTHNYYLTLKTWANNLDQHKDNITQRWGELTYRKFQLYFWGCCHAMANNKLQAYRIVLRKKT
ncbi:MAG: class I SAM-dependent methyltransferase [Legionellaceae bacterium]|nr:class I SAM-dependent methyltransferase [Legionellaceae bacterium]